MPLTVTGRLVKPGGTEHPSLVDIAVSLSRQPRFAGHCRRWWSVLDHTLFCDELCKGSNYTQDVRLALLLHDAHEAVTADVPTDFKSEELKFNQRELDRDIMNAFYPGGAGMYRCWTGAVKGIDRRALCAEARVVGPPATPERTLELFGVCEETHEDVVRIKGLLEMPDLVFGWPPYGSEPQTNHPTVKEYLKRMTELM